MLTKNLEKSELKMFQVATLGPFLMYSQLNFGIFCLIKQQMHSARRLIKTKRNVMLKKYRIEKVLC